MPNDSTFLDEITESLKIYKYLNKNAADAKGVLESIFRAKTDEREEKKTRIRIFIEEALKNADIYVNGDKVTLSSHDPAAHLNEALGKLVMKQYNKLTYMETAPELSDIAAVFNDDGQMSFVGVADTTPNKLALDDVLQFISLNNSRHMKTSLKGLQDQFSMAPYGFDQKDVQWLVATLFKQGRISLTLNSQTLSLLNHSKDELVRYITKRDFVEKLLIDVRVRATDGQIRSVKEVMKDYFGASVSSDDDDVNMKQFARYADNKLKEFEDVMVEYRVNPRFPGKSTMENAQKRLKEVRAITEPSVFFKEVNDVRDDLLDDAEDTAPVFDFFNGEQKNIFEKALKYINIFENSKTYVREQEIIDLVADMETIINAKNPYSSIQKLPEMSQKFTDVYGRLLENEATEMRPIVANDRKVVMDTLNQKEFADVFRNKFNQKFEELSEKLDKSNEIAAVKNIKLESDTLKLRCLDEIEDFERNHAPQTIVPPVVPVTPGAGGEQPTTPPVGPTVVAKPVKKKKNLSISNVAGARTYTMETEADVDQFLAEMKKKIMQELGEDTIITLS